LRQHGGCFIHVYTRLGSRAGFEPAATLAGSGTPRRPEEPEVRSPLPVGPITLPTGLSDTCPYACTLPGPVS
jgi:hypothetical protein